MSDFIMKVKEDFFKVEESSSPGRFPEKTGEIYVAMLVCKPLAGLRR